LLCPSRRRRSSDHRFQYKSTIGLAPFRTQLSVTFSPFSQPKTLSPQTSFQRGGNHYGSHSSLSISPIMNTTTLCTHVYSVMLPCNNTLPIRSFRFKCCAVCHPNNNIIQLIIATIQRRTETLELDMWFDSLDMKLASNIFTCRMLTVLKLKRLVILEDIPQINNTISPLKTLHLDRMHFNTRKQIIDFLLSFPILEELKTNRVMEFVPKTADKIKCLPNLVTANLSASNDIPLFLLSKALRLSIKLVVSNSLFDFSKQITI